MSSVREEWGLVSICDIVLNHTANETPWLAEHPEATYNLVNSPHLRPAFILDRAVKRLARDIGEGAWVDRGIPRVISRMGLKFNTIKCFRGKSQPLNTLIFAKNYC